MVPAPRSRSRRPRRLHASAHARVPRSLSGPHRQRASFALAGVPRRTGDRRCAGGRSRDHRRHRSLRRRRARHRCGDPPGARQRRAARNSGGTDPRSGAPHPPRGGDRAVRALISVYDKTGLQDFARGLADLGFELVASGGTAEFLENEVGLDVERVEELTGVAAMLGGRVKTLHPRIHAAILARRDHAEDVADLDEQEIRPFDIVCVNLYPFSEVAGRYGVREEEAVEMIDVGGPSMLRGAAKNFAHVAPVCRPNQYEDVLAELREKGDLSLATRRDLAAEAFATTAAYEIAIARWFGDVEAFPNTLVTAFDKVLDLRYGENPHQRGAYYAEQGARVHLLSRVEQLHGKELSLINLMDLSAARLTLREFALPACVIIKHANPCGVAVAGTIEEAYERALASDPVSAFGMVCAVNRPVSAGLGEALAERFVDVVFAPDYDEQALESLRRKEAIRILHDRERRGFTRGERDFKRVLGGVLVQDRDWDVDDRETMQVACGEPDEACWGDLVFAWRVCKHVGSNAIVLAKDLATIGIGGGQTSRVDSVRIALDKAREHGHDLEGAVLASDAFFPFPDGPQAALDAGVTAIIQPGGSKRDDEVAQAVQTAGATMVLTGRRHFRH
ncbi:MAG: bifunctional phosphoribosylaminoimidazolecarboxamide formyltransferase/IMP cyclohydrolase [Actinobacteria bacterium]|nr:bifunctional phosphoribosylaminoimidazolecarboxamide formyltransferase/IMP cyclohydrolase [Actinomycetota bacterium]